MKCGHLAARVVLDSVSLRLKPSTSPEIVNQKPNESEVSGKDKVRAVSHQLASKPTARSRRLYETTHPRKRETSPQRA